MSWRPSASALIAQRLKKNAPVTAMAAATSAMRTTRTASGRSVDLPAGLLELLGLLAQALGQRDRLGGHPVLGGVLADLLGDLHRAELRPAHRAEVGDLGS